MKRILVSVTVLLFLLTSHSGIGTSSSVVFAETSIESQKDKDKKGKKKPPGPPVVRGKEPRDSGKGNKPPKKGKN